MDEKQCFSPSEQKNEIKRGCCKTSPNPDIIHVLLYNPGSYLDLTMERKHLKGLRFALFKLAEAEENGVSPPVKLSDIQLQFDFGDI